MNRIDGAVIPKGLEHSLGRDETVAAVAVPEYSTPRAGQNWAATLVLTGHRLILSKDQTHRGPTELIVRPQNAVVVESAIRSGYYLR